MSFGMIVTRLAWIAHRFVSSKRPTRYASDASWSARIAWDWNRRSVLKSWAISRTSLWNGSLRMSSSVDFWYFLWDGGGREERGRSDLRSGRETGTGWKKKPRDRPARKDPPVNNAENAGTPRRGERASTRDARAVRAAKSANRPARRLRETNPRASRYVRADDGVGTRDPRARVNAETNPTPAIERIMRT